MIEATVASVFSFALVFTAIAVFPIKWAGGLMGSTRTSIGTVLAAMALSLPLGFLGSEALGLGLLGAYLGFSVAIFAAMRPSMLGALVIPLLALIILVVVAQVGAELGLIEFTSELK